MALYPIIGKKFKKKIKKMKLNLGCSFRDFGRDWVHVDLGDYDHLDYKCDVFKLPFDDNSADLIYASHVLEYFDWVEARDVLTEWHRVLKIGGSLMVAVPNFEAMAKLYVVSQVPLRNFVGPLYGRMQMGDAMIYHKTTYDYQSLSEILSTVGFSGINTYDWQDTDFSEHDDFSKAYIPHMDKENGTLISLNVKCTK